MEEDTIRNMSGKLVQTMVLNSSAPGRHYGTCLEAKQANSPTIGSLAEYEKDSVIHSSVTGPIHPPTFGKYNYVVTLFTERAKFARAYMT